MRENAVEEPQANAAPTASNAAYIVPDPVVSAIFPLGNVTKNADIKASAAHFIYPADIFSFRKIAAAAD